MMNWLEATKELEKPLDKGNVKGRQQSGRRLSYVEGWHVIAEANRIFGFGEWSRETVEIKCVVERERSIGKDNPQPGWGVSYTAKVRVTVSGVTREGVGAGHGIDRDCGLAHESAIKEAETDAMKRAFMTFGNLFGLALYDKEQTNVSSDEPTHKSNGHAPAPAPLDWSPKFITLRDTLGMIEDETSLNAWIDMVRAAIGGKEITNSERATLQDRLAARRSYLAQAPGQAA